MVERGSLENCWRRKALVGSNPTPSAMAAKSERLHIQLCPPSAVTQTQKSARPRSAARGSSNPSLSVLRALPATACRLP